jgi:hypothetical protein
MTAAAGIWKSEAHMTKSMGLGIAVGLVTAIVGLVIFWQAARLAAATHGVGDALHLKMDRIYTTTGAALISFGLALTAAALWDWIKHGGKSAGQ